MATQNNTNTFDTLLSDSEAGNVVSRTVAAQTANAALETPIFVAPVNAYVGAVSVNRVTLVPSAAIVGAATNTQTFTLKRYTVAGALVGTVGTSFATTASLAKFVATPLISTTPILLKSGEVLTLVDTAAGTGAITPELTVTVEYSVIPVMN